MNTDFATTIKNALWTPQIKGPDNAMADRDVACILNATITTHCHACDTTGVSESCEACAGPHELTIAELLTLGKHAAETGNAKHTVELLHKIAVLETELATATSRINALNATITTAGKDLYQAEVRRQGIGWDDHCTTLLIRSQHALAYSQTGHKPANPA